MHWKDTPEEDDNWILTSRVRKAKGGAQAIKAAEEAIKAAEEAEAAAKAAEAAAEAAAKAAAAREAAAKAAAAKAAAEVAAKAAKAKAAKAQPAQRQEPSPRGAAASVAPAQKAAAKQKRQESTEDAAAPKPPKKARHESPTAAQKPAASSAAPAAPAAAAASPVKLRTGQSMSALTLDQQELLDEFELWQMHGQANPPQEKTCKGYFKAVKNFVEHEYSDFDVARKWNLCNLKRYEELRMTVRASAKDKKGHGHCSAALAKFANFLRSRRDGWHSTKSQRDGSVKPKAAAKSAAKSSRAPPKAAARANDAKKQELAALMAEDERRTAKRKEREKEQRKAEKRQKRSEHQRGGDREEERKLKRRAERSSENEEASRTKPAAAKIPKKKAPGIPKKQVPKLTFGGKDIVCGECSKAILLESAADGACVDGKIFCASCLPAEHHGLQARWRRDSRDGRNRPPSQTGASGRRDRPSSATEPSRPLQRFHSNTPCRYFNTPQGCGKGDRCNFSHQRPTAVPTSRPAATHSAPQRSRWRPSEYTAESQWTSDVWEDVLADGGKSHPPSLVNHVVSVKLGELVPHDQSSENWRIFESAIDQLLEHKRTEQASRESSTRSTTCASRWMQQEYEVDQSMRTPLDLKDKSYDTRRIKMPARGVRCEQSFGNAFDLYSHCKSMVQSDMRLAREAATNHLHKPEKFPNPNDIPRGNWGCPFCPKNAACFRLEKSHLLHVGKDDVGDRTCGWAQLEIDPTVLKVLEHAPDSCDQVTVYCAGLTEGEPALPGPPVGGVVPFVWQGQQRQLAWHVPGAESAGAGGPSADDGQSDEEFDLT